MRRIDRFAHGALAARMPDCGALENRCAASPYRGFESLPLRFVTASQAVATQRVEKQRRNDGRQGRGERGDREGQPECQPPDRPAPGPCAGVGCRDHRMSASVTMGEVMVMTTLPLARPPST